MTTHLQEMINHSGDSILEGYNYSDGYLNISLRMFDSNQTVGIEIRTDILSFSHNYLYKKDELHRTCRIEMTPLVNKLSIENGFFIPAKNFGKFMNECRADYNLAYGKRVSEYTHLLSLVGYERILSCLVDDLDRIIIV